MCHLVARGIYIRWQHLILLFIYIVQLYKEDWGILRMLGCWAVALPSTEQIVTKHHILQFTNFLTITMVHVGGHQDALFELDTKLSIFNETFKLTMGAVSLTLNIQWMY